MKRIIFTICFLMVAVHSYGAIPDIGWTAAIDANWTAMESGNDKIYTAVKENADNIDPCENNYGMDEAVMYRLTSTAGYASKAYDRIFQYAGFWADRNKTRDSYASIASVCLLACDGMSAGEKASVLSLLDTYFEKVTGQDPYGNHGTRCSYDTDECMGHYFGVVLHALIYANDNPSKMNSMLSYSGNYGSVGGVDYTGDNVGTWRNAVYHFIINYGKGGDWVESSAYNYGTLRYIFDAYHFISDYYGATDHFPEITGAVDDLADRLVAQQVSNISEQYMWGDVQNQNQPRGQRSYNSMGVYNLASYLDNNATVRYIADILFDTKTTACFAGDWALYAEGTDTLTAPSGLVQHFDHGMGIAYNHTSWGSSDSFSILRSGGRTFADHETDAWLDFGLYRSDGIAVTSPRLYFGQREAENPYLNGVLLYGAMGIMREAFGRIYQEFGTDYSAIGGLTGGIYHKNGADDPYPDTVREHTNQRIVLHNSDGSDTAVFFDRIESCRPTDTSCIDNSSPSWKLGKLHEDYWQPPADGGSRMHDGSFAHHFVMNTNEAVTQNGDRFNWTAENGEEVYLWTYIPGYSYANFQVDDYTDSTPYYFGGTLTASEIDEYQIRLTQASNTGYTRATGEFFDWLNVLHVGGTLPTLTEIDVSAGEDVHGVLIDLDGEKKLVAYNSENDNTTTFTSAWYKDVGYVATYDPDRFSKTADMSKFQVGNTIEFTTTDAEDIIIYIMNLDPALSWTITKAKDGGGATSLGCTVTSQGTCLATISGASGDYDIVFSSGAAAQTCYDNDCELCLNEPECLGSDLTCYWHDTNDCYDYQQSSPADCDDQCSACSEVDGGIECEASIQTCYWHDNDLGGASDCYTYNSDQNICILGSVSYCDNQTDCEAAGFCWEDSDCITECSPTPPPVENELTIYATADIMLDSSAAAVNQDGSDLGATIASGGGITLGRVNSGGSDDADSKTVSFTTEACSDQIMIIHVGTEETGDTTPNSVTYNGDAATLGKADSYWNGEKSSIYYLLNPDVGTYNLIATYDGGASVDIMLGAVTYCGLVQQAPEASCNGEDSCSITTVTTGALVLGGISNVAYSNNTVTGVLDTEHYDQQTPAWGANSSLGSGTAGAAGAYTCGFTNGITGNRSGTACVAFEATGGAATEQSFCLRFAGTDITAGSSIVDAQLQLNMQAAPTGLGTLDAYESLQAWVEAQATWNVYSTGNSWNTAGARGDATDITGDYTDGTSRLTTYTIGGAEDINSEIIFTSETGGSFESYIQNNIGSDFDICIQQRGTTATFKAHDTENGTAAYRPRITIFYNSDVEPTRPSPGGRNRSINGGTIINMKVY